MEFEKIKKEWIVDEKEYSKTKLLDLISKLNSSCKITKTGQVIISKKIPTRKILKLIISARFIANAADSSILQGIAREELKTYSGLKDKIFVTRINEMLRENFAERMDEKNLRAKNILLIERFLNDLENGRKNRDIKLKGGIRI